MQIPLRAPKPSGATISVQSVTLLWEVVPSEAFRHTLVSDRINSSPFLLKISVERTILESLPNF